MDYTQDGTRTITQIIQGIENSVLLYDRANVLKTYHDEVYIVDFDPNSQPFIQEIVLNGCRI